MKILHMSKREALKLKVGTWIEYSKDDKTHIGLLMERDPHARDPGEMMLRLATVELSAANTIDRFSIKGVWHTQIIRALGAVEIPSMFPTNSNEVS